MQSRTLLHAQVAGQTALGKEICGELHGTAETGADHSSIDTTVYAPNTLALVDLAKAIKGVFIVVLGADGEERRVGLKTGLHKEERRPCCSTNDTRSSSCNDIGTEGLDLGIFVYSICEVCADRFVEAQTAAVKQDLVDILHDLNVRSMRLYMPFGEDITYSRSNTSEQTPRSFIL